MSQDKFYCNKKKLSYIVKQSKCSQKYIANKLDLSEGTISKYLGSTDGATLKLENIHIYSILSICKLPYKVFFDCQTKEEIANFIELRKETKTTVSKQIPSELKKLLGISYLYSYNNNLKGHAALLDRIPSDKKVKVNFINEVQINIDNHGTVTDKQENIGQLLMLTDNLSIIFIEDRKNKDTILYTFSNQHLNLKQFLFGKRSKWNHSNEMLAFGFLSKEKLNADFVQFFLDKDETKTQLRVNADFLDNLSSYNGIEEEY